MSLSVSPSTVGGCELHLVRWDRFCVKCGGGHLCPLLVLGRCLASAVLECVAFLAVWNGVSVWAIGYPTGFQIL